MAGPEGPVPAAGRPTNQKPKRWISIGARVSATPRSTPLATTWVPSNTWKNPASGINSTAISSTFGWSVKMRARGPGRIRNSRAKSTITAGPITRATPAARLAPSWRPPPISLPTRTAAAIDMPRGTMKESEASISAVWWPAIWSAPSPPIMYVTTPKAPTSITNCTPTGKPMPSIRFKASSRSSRVRRGVR